MRRHAPKTGRNFAGRPGKDHLFLVDGKGTQHVDCANVALPYGKQLIADVLNRTETAMTQEHCFKAMELAITAQNMAERGTECRDHMRRPPWTSTCWCCRASSSR